MNRFRTPVLAALALIACTAAAQASITVEKPFQQSYPLKSGGTLEVSNTNGGITVEAWDRAEVRVEAVKKIKAESSQKAEEIAKQVKIDVRQSAGSVRIETILPHSGGFLDWLTGNNASVSVTYRIKAPRDVVAKLDNTNGGLRLVGTRGRAELETVNGGVTVERTEGAVQVETTNGSITVIQAAGALDGSTTNGSITAQLSRVDGDITLETTNGSVSLKVPQDLRADLDVSTWNGGIHSDLDVQGGEKSRKHLSGEVNGGGGLLKVHTTNGGVRIEAE
ncbi:MAG: DUF4097 family beta strand repeat-containing protein [Acidobacteriota bacterium]